MRPFPMAFGSSVSTVLRSCVETPFGRLIRRADPSGGSSGRWTTETVFNRSREVSDSTVGSGKCVRESGAPWGPPGIDTYRRRRRERRGHFARVGSIINGPPTSVTRRRCGGPSSTHSRCRSALVAPAYSRRPWTGCPCPGEGLPRKRGTVPQTRRGSSMRRRPRPHP